MFGNDAEAGVDRRSYLTGSAALGLLSLGAGNAVGSGDRRDQTETKAKEQRVREIDECTTITESGRYELVTDLTAAPGDTCLEIRASDVTLDGNGHTITGRDAAAPADDRFPFDSGSTGVLVRPPGSETRRTCGTERDLSRVSVENLIVEGFHTGIAVYETAKAELVGTHVKETSHGIFLFRAIGSVLSRNRAESNSETGYSLLDASENILKENEAVGNSDAGFRLDRFSTGSTGNLLLENAAADNFSDGIRITDSDSNAVKRNATSGSATGIAIEDSRKILVENNDAGALDTAIYLTGAAENTLSGNDAVTETFGIRLSESHRNAIATNDSSRISLESSHQNTLKRNSASGIQGIVLDRSHENTLEGNTANDSLSAGILLSESHENRLLKNTADENRTYGFRLENASWNTGRGNSARDNGDGPIEIVGGDGNEIEVNGVRYTDDEFDSQNAGSSN
ncbi:NosD domain-containing protein [Haloterrigena salinisoli]|uniref:NosD domain-containing protein n=1 Tax=Haloterrigena salinisoli TaxID=3132747 RepID=UPI0030D16A11